jgi:hypothetical protein
MLLSFRINRLAVKISRSSKARAFSRRHLVTRPVTETARNYRWWLFQDVEPAEGFLLDTWTTNEPVYPRLAPAVTRLPKRTKLSRRALRKRLYQNLVPKAQWAGLLAEYAGRGIFRMAGEPSLRDVLGFAISNAVTRHVHVRLLILDEYYAYAAPGLAQFGGQMRSGHKDNSACVEVIPALRESPAVEEVEAAASLQPALLYDYPDSRYRRVEGKSMLDLEEEIMAGGPFPDSRSSRTRSLAEDSEHLLHFVAKYYLFLAHERAKNWVLDPGQSLMPIPNGCEPKAVPAL